MKINSYLNSSYHKIFEEARQHPLEMTKELIYNYFNVEKPIAVEFFSKTSFCIAKDENNNPVFLLKCPNLDELDSVRNIKKYDPFEGYGVKRPRELFIEIAKERINGYLKRESYDKIIMWHMTKRKPYKNTAELVLFTKFKQMVYTALKDKKTEMSIPLSENEVDIFKKDFEKNGDKNTKLEFAEKKIEYDYTK